MSEAEILSAAEERMKNVIESTRRDLAAIRTGRANPGSWTGCRSSTTAPSPP